MLFLVCGCIEPANTLYVSRSGFALVGTDAGRNGGAGSEVRCAGVRIHGCRHIRQEAFQTHPAGSSPAARFTQKHQHFGYCDARDEHLMV